MPATTSLITCKAWSVKIQGVNLQRFGQIGEVRKWKVCGDWRRSGLLNCCPKCPHLEMSENAGLSTLSPTPTADAVRRTLRDNTRYM
jgi:hypothetical protein